MTYNVHPLTDGAAIIALYSACISIETEWLVLLFSAWDLSYQHGVDIQIHPEAHKVHCTQQPLLV